MHADRSRRISIRADELQDKRRWQAVACQRLVDNAQRFSRARLVEHQTAGQKGEQDLNRRFGG